MKNLRTIITLLLLPVFGCGVSNEESKEETVQPEPPIVTGDTAYVASTGTAVQIEYKQVKFEGENIDCSVMLPNWLRVKVLDQQLSRKDWTVKRDKVEVLEGSFKGMTGFLRYDWVHAQQRGKPDFDAIIRVDYKLSPDEPCPVGYDFRESTH